MSASPSNNDSSLLARLKAARARRRASRAKRVRPNGAKYEKPVAWLLGRQLLGSLKGILLHTAYGEKLDPRHWMHARAFPAQGEAEALRFWREPSEQAARDAARPQDAPATPPDLQELRNFWRDKKVFWFDYIADTGDGMMTTYNVAYLCQSNLYVASDEPTALLNNTAPEQRLKNREVKKKSEPGYEQKLPRGEFLFIGGDTAYHAADYMTLANRVQVPFNWAYQDLRQEGQISDEDPRRLLIGIPANHDYYDQLDGFQRQFRRKTAPETTDRAAAHLLGKPQLPISGFYRAQDASYVALRLPFGWWLWGLDTEVGQIDEQQEAFFRELWEADPNDPNRTIPPAKLILATCVPTTVFGKIAQPEDHKAAAAISQLDLSQPFLPDKGEDGVYDLATTGDKKLSEAERCRLDLSGDVHHYARYWGPQTESAASTRAWAYPEDKTPAPAAEHYASVVAGLGGAFHHPTHTYVGEVKEQALYPSEQDSTREVARRIFKFWNILTGGLVWLFGFLIAFVIFFSSTIPQSSRQLINNALAKIPYVGHGLVASEEQPLNPTVISLPDLRGHNQNNGGTNWAVPLGRALSKIADAPVTTFWGGRVWPRVRALFVGCDQPACASTQASWTPPTSEQLAQPRPPDEPSYFFFGRYGVTWPTDIWIGAPLAILSLALMGFVVRNKGLFGQKGQSSMPGADSNPAEIVDTARGREIQPKPMDPAINARPAKWLWLAMLLSVSLFFLALASIEPYRAHITPFGSSMMVLLSLVWAGLAVALSIRYTKFLFKKAHGAYIRRRDWALPWGLAILSVLSITLGLWSFGRNNLPAYLVSDIIFVLILIALAIVLVYVLPFKVSSEEMLRGHRRAARISYRLLFGIWHTILQLSVPFLLIRRGSILTWLIAILLLTVATLAGQWLLQAKQRVLLALAWGLFGALMLALPFVTSRGWFSTRLASLPIRGAWSWLPPWLLSSPFFPTDTWTGWAGLLPTLLAGGVGALMSCVWFGWYLAVCFAFNGHNNEVGGAARIEDFGQFIRFRLTENDLTAYVIGFAKAEPKGQDLQPHIIDVFRLTVKPAAPA